MLPGYLGKGCQLLDSPKADSKVKIRVTDLRGEGEPSMEVKKRWKGKEPTAVASSTGKVRKVIPPSTTQLWRLCTISYWVLVVFGYFPSVPGAV